MSGAQGSAIYATWVYSGGTVILTTDFRKFDDAPSIDLVDETAGADPTKQYLAGRQDGKISFAGVYQTDGSALYTALLPGVSGTLTYGREGTATGKPKVVIPAISMGAKTSHPYDNIIEITNEFQQNGARTNTTW